MPTETQPAIKANSRGMTSLLVSIHIDARRRLAEASRLTGVSQQSIIRNGIEMALMAILERPEAEAAGKRGAVARKHRKPRKAVLS